MRAILISRLRACLPKSLDMVAVPVKFHSMVNLETDWPLLFRKVSYFQLHNDLWNL